MSRVKLLLDLADDIRAVAEDFQALANAMVEGTSPAEQGQDQTAAADKPEKPKEQAPTITLEQVRAVLVDKTHDGFTADVQALLRKYGASKLSAIDPKNYAALLKDAEEIGNGA